MKKDIEWAQKEIDSYLSYEGVDAARNALMFARKLINQLDGLEVLSEYWIEQKSIDTHVDTLNGEIQVTFILDDLKNLIIPKQELPSIPKFVAEWIVQAKKWRYSISDSMGHATFYGDTTQHDKAMRWGKNNQDIFARAWLDGFTVAEEPKYYALMKGHELIDNGTTHWYFDNHKDGVFVSKMPVIYGDFLTEMSKSEWNKLGINDSNADFVTVEEVEE